MASNWTIDTLQQHLELQIGYLKEKIALEKEILVTKDEAAKVALRLQFNENERRLDVLNHEAARLALMIPKEQFDIVVNQLKKEIEESKDKIIELQKYNSNRDGRMYVITFVWGLLLLLLSWALNHKF